MGGKGGFGPGTPSWNKGKKQGKKFKIQNGLMPRGGGSPGIARRETPKNPAQKQTNKTHGTNRQGGSPKK